MIVLDASIVVELLLRRDVGDRIRDELSKDDSAMVAPHLLDIEVVSAIRGLAAAKRIDAARCHELLQQLLALPATRVPHAPFLHRIWELRHDFTAYDATYIALAESTDAVLYTTDVRMRKGHQARVRVFSIQ